MIAILILALVLGLIAWFVFTRDNEHHWIETYFPNKKEPYDTYVIHEQLKNGLGESKFNTISDTIYREVLATNDSNPSSIVFIGNEMFLDSAETDFFLKYVERGNSAFLSCNYFPQELIEFLIYAGDEYEYYYNEVDGSYSYEFTPTVTVEDTTVSLKLLRQEIEIQELSCSYIVDYEKSSNRWHYFRKDLYNHDLVYLESIGVINDSLINFVRVPYGEGNFYLHTTPLIFTNYHLLSDSVNEYAKSALSVLNDTRIYWDEKDRYYDPMSTELPQGSAEKGPLEFLLTEPTLKIAWYMVLATSFLYLLFGSRRKQRIIPVIENMNNTSIEYAEVVSQLFMKEKDHKKLVLLKMDLFKVFLRERFALRIPTDQKQEGEEFYKNVASRADVPYTLVLNIFEQFKYLSAISHVETEPMLTFYNQIEEFYSNCK